jgi:hypothetical protein
MEFKHEDPKYPQLTSMVHTAQLWQGLVNGTFAYGFSINGDEMAWSFRMLCFTLSERPLSLGRRHGRERMYMSRFKLRSWAASD